jgi:hypothetical protein
MYLRSLIVVLSTWTALISAQCGRTQLIQARDNFFQAGKTGAAPSIASSAKIAYNNKRTPLAKTPFALIGNSTWSKLNVEAVDTEKCEIATFRVAKEMLLSTRLKLDANSGSINEVEFLQAVSGDILFLPSGFPSETPALWMAKQIPHPPPIIPSQWTPAGGMLNHSSSVSKSNCKATKGDPRLWTRRELAYAVSSYADGLRGKDPFTSCVFDSGWCPRVENGIPTSWNCAQFLFFDFNVQGRRFTVDTETGVVLGAFYFDSKGTQALVNKQLFLHEYFKVEKGGLKYIYAPMIGLPSAQATAEIYEQETK